MFKILLSYLLIIFSLQNHIQIESHGWPIYDDDIPLINLSPTLYPTQLRGHPTRQRIYVIKKNT